MVQTAVSFFFDYPKGLRDLLVYTKEKYNDPPIYITETGMSNSVISFLCTKFNFKFRNLPFICMFLKRLKIMTYLKLQNNFHESKAFLSFLNFIILLKQNGEYIYTLARAKKNDMTFNF